MKFKCNYTARNLACIDSGFPFDDPHCSQQWNNFVRCFDVLDLLETLLAEERHFNLWGIYVRRLSVSLQTNQAVYYTVRAHQ